jgi:hypothetical protein
MKKTKLHAGMRLEGGKQQKPENLKNQKRT